LGRDKELNPNSPPFEGGMSISTYVGVLWGMTTERCFDSNIHYLALN